MHKAILLLALFASGCSTVSNSKVQGLRQTGAELHAAPVTQLGVNTSPEVSRDGQKIYFVSARQPKHSHPQAYEFDLKTKSLTRLTFQNGEVHQALATPNGNIIYSSDTDEIKEDPDYIRKALAPPHAPPPPEGGAKNPFGESLPRTEIYSANRKANSILRMTERKGFDGFIAVNPKTGDFSYSAWNGSFFELWLYSFASGTRRALTQNFYDIDSSFSPDGQSLAWVRWNPPTNTADIFIGNKFAQNPKFIIGGNAIYRTLAFSPNGEWLAFSANIHDFTNFEIYRVRTDGSCLERLTYHTARDSYPRFHPLENKLYFQSNRSGDLQIYELDLNLAATCPSAKP